MSYQSCDLENVKADGSWKEYAKNCKLILKADLKNKFDVWNKNQTITLNKIKII